MEMSDCWPLCYQNKNPDTCWMGPRAGLDVMTKKIPLTLLNQTPVLPLASQFTDWANPTCKVYINKTSLIFSSKINEDRQYNKV
jgi:hypothetical protein